MIKKILILLILLILSLGVVSASDNVTEDVAFDDQTLSINQTPSLDDFENDVDEHSPIAEVNRSQIDTKIDAKNIKTYYKENSELVGFLKDANNNPIPNKKVSILINNKIYNKSSDNLGKFVLKLNLKPNTYKTVIKFTGDENYSASCANTIVKVNATILSIQTKNYKTYFESDLFFKAKVINKVTKNPVKGVKVAFNVYFSKNKYKTYYATTDANGIAELKKNFKVGSYKVVTNIKKNKYLKAKKTKSTLTIKETAEMGCSSLYVQVSNTEAVAGFRRDATNAKNLHIVKYKLNGIYAVKQYKTNSYFFHTITAANGWMAGTGGWDNPTINHAIEKLAGKMFKSGKINKAYLKKIQKYERQLKIGHFSIKAPNGKYALVWGSSIVYGKLKPGEYICVPNGKSCFRHGTYTHFDKNPSKAAIKIAASDSFGVNRRDATVFHWKATTKEGKTTATLKVYAANDNGRMMGRSTGHLKDNIYFKGKFISKNSLPKTPSSKFLGTYKFGNIDKLIKAKTIVKAPKVTINGNESKVFKVTVKNKSTNKPINALVIKLKIDGKTYSITTNKKGVAQFKTNNLSVGTHNVVLYTNNIKYLLNSKSTIVIEE